MLLTMLITVRVKGLNKEEIVTYSIIVFTHVVMIVVGLMYHFFFSGMHMLAAQLNIFAMIL